MWPPIRTLRVLGKRPCIVRALLLLLLRLDALLLPRRLRKARIICNLSRKLSMERGYSRSHAL